MVGESKECAHMKREGGGEEARKRWRSAFEI